MNINFVKNKKIPPGYLTVQTAESLLINCKVDKLIQECRQLVSLPTHIFDKYYFSAIKSFTEFIQLSPASEANHHAYPGGLLIHTLEVIVYSLRKRKGLLLPCGVSAEAETETRDIYTYGIFCAALSHDLAKPAVDQEIVYLTHKNDTSKPWNPFKGSLVSANAKYYQIRFKEGRKYTTHEKSALIFIVQVIPSDGLYWLMSEPVIFEQLLLQFTDNDDKGQFHKIVHEADRLSVSKALGAQQSPNFSLGIPLHLKIRNALRMQISEGKLTLNRVGANGWVAQGHVWILAKTVADQIRIRLQEDGHTGIPSDNNRMFDIMMDNGLISKTDNGKAVWRVQVETLNWKPEVFSVVKVPLNVACANSGIDEFSGTLSVKNSKDTIPENSDPNNQFKSMKTIKETTKETTSDQTTKRQITNEIPAPENMNVVDERTESHKLDIQRTRESIGTDFFFWLIEGINNNTIKCNTSDAPVHNTSRGLLLVSPRIFKDYSDLKINIDWQRVQKSFQALRINLKTKDKGENAFKVRVSGKRKLSMLNAWIIPHSELFDCELPRINEHLEVITASME